jgi:hypothetical protein
MEAVSYGDYQADTQQGQPHYQQYLAKHGSAQFFNDDRRAVGDNLAHGLADLR